MFGLQDYTRRDAGCNFKLLIVNSDSIVFAVKS